MASSFPARGLVADAYLHIPKAVPKRSSARKMTAVAAALGFVAVLACQLVTTTQSGDKTSAQDAVTEPPFNSYEFAVYALNHTSRTSDGTTTVFSFDGGHLPFDYGSLLFDEFRGDTACTSRYYAGMSLLAWVEGPQADLEFLENGGSAIEEISYQSQALVVLNGWECTSEDGQGRVLDHSWGSMQIVAYDWRDSTWNPEQGIAVEHPAEITISRTSLCLMVYEPTASTDIPEFGSVFACLAFCAVVLTVRRLKKR